MGWEYLTRHTPPQDQAGTPPGPGRYPPGPGRYPPGTRLVPPQDQAGTPRPGRYTPPGPGTPPEPGRQPQTRYTPQDQAGTPPDQVHPPRTRQVHPPGPGTPPRKQQTPEYGQRSAGTHPTGMHSCDRVYCTVEWPHIGRFTVFLTSRQHEEIIVAALYECGGCVRCYPLILIVHDYYFTRYIPL